MSNRYAYPSNNIYAVDRGITRLDQSADRIAASLAGSDKFGYDSDELLAQRAYDLAEAVIAEGDKRKEAA